MGCLNIYGLKNKAQTVKDLGTQHQLDVFGLCETWHKVELVDS